MAMYMILSKVFAVLTLDFEDYNSIVGIPIIFWRPYKYY